MKIQKVKYYMNIYNNATDLLCIPASVISN